MASRTAAVFVASSALSTTGGCLEGAFSQHLLRRVKIQILEDGARPARDEPGAVADEDDAAIAEGAVGQPGGGALSRRTTSTGRPAAVSRRAISSPMSWCDNLAPATSPIATSTSLPEWSVARATEPYTSAKAMRGSRPSTLAITSFIAQAV